MNDPLLHDFGSGEPSLVMVGESELPSKIQESTKLPFHGLPGEVLQKGTKGQDYYILATNFRLFASFEESFFNIPLYSIDYAEIREIVILFIYCKDGKTFKVTFEAPEICSDWYYQLVSLTSSPEKTEQLFAYAYCANLTSEVGNVTPILNSCRDFSELYRIVAEKNRMGFDTERIWRVTEVNTQFGICPSYPKLHLVPSWVPDENIRASAKFRSMGRFPSVVWRHKRNGAVIARSSQPEVGLFGWRSSEDELLLTAIAQASSLDKDGTSSEMATSVTTAAYVGKPLLIVDARSYTAAVANRAKGGGCECQEYYIHCEVQFMGMANIHGIRKSMQSLRNICSQGLEQNNWYSLLDGTKWLHYLSALLKSSVFLVETLDKREQSTLVHCSDGWDRTTQLVALAELLLDPYYRSMQGFQVLVEREWLEFGHKFGDRCGHSTDRDTNERCPVFLQWLDCVYQVSKQFPTAFEFNEGYLVKLAEHAYSCLFGTFLGNSLKEKQEAKIRAKTLSLWSLLNSSRREFRNFLYYPTDKVLYPQHHVRCLILWERVYLTTNISLKDIPMYCEETYSVLADSGRFSSSYASSGLNVKDFSGCNPIINAMADANLTETFLQESHTTHAFDNGSVGSSERDDSDRERGDAEHDVEAVKEEVENLATDSSEDALENGELCNGGDDPFMNRSTTSSLQTVVEKDDYQDALSDPIPSTSQSSHSAADNSTRNKEIGCSESVCSRSEPNLPLLAHPSPNGPNRYNNINNDVVAPILRTKSLTDAMSVSAIDIGKSNRNNTFSIAGTLKNISNFLYVDGLLKPWTTVEYQLNLLDLNHRVEVARLRKKLEVEHQRHMVGAHISGGLTASKEQDTPDDLLSLPDSLNGERASMSSISNEEGWEKVHLEDVQPTLWYPDHLAVSCNNCDVLFGNWVRKHHCRNCGNVFCYACCKCFVPVPKEQHYEGVRVCVSCYENLAKLEA